MICLDTCFVWLFLLPSGFYTCRRGRVGGAELYFLPVIKKRRIFFLDSHLLRDGNVSRSQ